MLATLLLLAQLVQSWPWLDSPLVQPGPTICVGECAGPVVWGPAERGRLVVACDMRSDTCSDGRKITTTRSTPVLCEVAPGQWEMVGVDEGCYSVHGLESWAANTSYLAYGAELDRSPWQAVDGATVQSLPTGGYRVIGTGSNSRIMQPGIPAVPGPHTLSCIARSVDETPKARMRIYWDASAPGSVAIPVTAEWAVHSITATVPEEWEGNISIHVFSSTGTVDVIGCWLTRTSTPGRACWGGEAPVTCAGDRHTISTEGWPTEAGEISIAFSLRRQPGVFQTIINSRVGTIGNDEFVFEVSNSDRLVVRGWGNQQSSGVLDWPEKEYSASIAWGPWGRRVKLNGVTVIESTEATVMGFGPTAVLGGSNINLTQQIDGSIRSLTVRSYEEVSP